MYTYCESKKKKMLAFTKVQGELIGRYWLKASAKFNFKCMNFYMIIGIIRIFLPVLLTEPVTILAKVAVKRDNQKQYQIC